MQWRNGEHNFEAALSQRARFHVAYRIGARAYDAVIRSRAGLRRPLRRAIVLSIYDAAGAGFLRRDNSYHRALRLFGDAFDVALASIPFEHYDPAVLVGVPLAVEAGIREGISGLWVPLVSGTVTAGVRRRRGRPLSLWAFRWQAMAVLTGIGLAAYEGREREAAASAAIAGIEARVRESYVAGQNDVAVGADTVLDLLCRTAPLVASPSAREAPGRALAGWKQALAEQTTTRAAYLGTVVSRWASLHNAASSDLSSDAVVSLADGDGTAVLTASQATWLAGSLDTLELRGDVRIGFADPAVRARSHDRRSLMVNEYIVEIPPDAAPALQGFEPMPLILAGGAMWALEPALSESQIGVPIAVDAATRKRWDFNEAARLTPTNRDGSMPDREQDSPGTPQIDRFWEWATRAKRR
jgi:hypothetical protein